MIPNILLRKCINKFWLLALYMKMVRECDYVSGETIARRERQVTSKGN